MKVLSNVGLSVVSVSIRLGAAAVALILQARLLGPEIFSQFVFAASIAVLASILLDYGMSLRILRTLPTSAGRERAQIVEDLRLKCTLTIPYALLATIATLLLARGAILEFACIFLAAAASAYGDYGMAVLRALGRYSLEAKLITIVVTLHAGILTAAAIFFPTLLGAAVAFLISRLIYVVLVAAVLNRTIPQQRDAGGQFRLVPALKQASPYVQDVAISNSLGQLDMLIAGLTLSGPPLAHYAIASRCFLVVDQGLGALANVFIPGLSSVQNERSEFKRGSAALIWLIAITGLLGSVAAILIGPWLFVSVLGAAYSGLSPHIGLIAVAILARLAVAASAIPIVALGQQTLRVRCQLIGLAVFLTGAWPAALAGGLDGLIAITALTYGCIALLQFVALERSGIHGPRLAYLCFALSLACASASWLTHGAF